MRQNGTIKFFNQSKGYGFIKPDDSDKDVFIHISALEQSGLAALDQGARVTFETAPDKKGRGPQAVNIEVTE